MLIIKIALRRNLRKRNPYSLVRKPYSSENATRGAAIFKQGCKLEPQSPSTKGPWQPNRTCEMANQRIKDWKKLSTMNDSNLKSFSVKRNLLEEAMDSNNRWVSMRFYRLQHWICITCITRCYSVVEEQRSVEVKFVTWVSIETLAWIPPLVDQLSKNTSKIQVTKWLFVWYWRIHACRQLCVIRLHEVVTRSG